MPSICNVESHFLMSAEVIVLSSSSIISGVYIDEEYTIWLIWSLYCEASNEMFLNKRQKVTALWLVERSGAHNGTSRVDEKRTLFSANIYFCAFAYTVLVECLIIMKCTLIAYCNVIPLTTK